MKIILSFILSFLVLEISAVEWQHVLEDGSSVKWEANLDSPSALPLEMQSGDLASYRLMMNGVGAQSLPPTINGRRGRGRDPIPSNKAKRHAQEGLEPRSLGGGAPCAQVGDAPAIARLHGANDLHVGDSNIFDFR